MIFPEISNPSENRRETWSKHGGGMENMELVRMLDSPEIKKILQDEKWER